MKNEECIWIDEGCYFKHLMLLVLESSHHMGRDDIEVNPLSEDGVFFLNRLYRRGGKQLMN